MAIRKDIINGKIFIRQTTYYVYKSNEDLNNDQPCLITSDINIFNQYKESQKKRNKNGT